MGLSLELRTRYTSPIPTLPRRSVISYEPSRVPIVMAMKLCGLYAIRQRRPNLVHRRHPFVPVRYLLVGEGEGEHYRLTQPRPADFQTDWQCAATEAAGNRDARQSVDVEWLRVAKRWRHSARRRRAGIGDGLLHGGRQYGVVGVTSTSTVEKTSFTARRRRSSSRRPSI